MLEEDFHARDGGEGARFDEGRADDPVADAKVRGGDVFEGGEVLAVDNLARSDDAVIGVGGVASAVGGRCGGVSGGLGLGDAATRRDDTPPVVVTTARATRGVGAGRRQRRRVAQRAGEAVHSRCVRVGETRDGPDSPAERRERVDACEKPSKLARRETRVVAESIFARTFPYEDATPKEDSRAPQDIVARIVPTSYLEWTKAGGEARAWVRRVGVGRRPSRVPSKEPKRTPWS